MPPDINKSFYDFVPENGNIRFGLVAIKNIGDQVAKAVIEERMRGGEFKNIEDFLIRVNHKDLNKKSLESFIKSGALDSLKIERGQALQNIDELLKFNSFLRKNGNLLNNSLFGNAAIPANSLKLNPVAPAAMAEKLAWEKELIGIYLSGHPLSPYKKHIESLKVNPVKEVKAAQKEGVLVKVAGLITKIVRILTKKNQPMLFAQIEDIAGDSIEIVVFSEVLKKTENIWREGQPIAVKGKTSPRNGEQKIIADAAIILKNNEG